MTHLPVISLVTVRHRVLHDGVSHMFTLLLQKDVR